MPWGQLSVIRLQSFHRIFAPISETCCLVKERFAQGFVERLRHISREALCLYLSRLLVLQVLPLLSATSSPRPWLPLRYG
jgi:surface polysaccharide O-acyltransferase-like enzyme